MPSYQQIVDGPSVYAHKLYRVTNWQADSSVPHEDTREEVTELADADVIVSEIEDRPGWHTIMLDLDVPHRYVPSTTPGHGHLYIDVPVPWDMYRELLVLLADMNVLEPGYVKASQSREATSLRLPWVRKLAPWATRPRPVEEEAAF